MEEGAVAVWAVLVLLVTVVPALEKLGLAKEAQVPVGQALEEGVPVQVEALYDRSLHCYHHGLLRGDRFPDEGSAHSYYTQHIEWGPTRNLHRFFRCAMSAPMPRSCLINQREG